MAVRPIDMQNVSVNTNEYSKIQQNKNAHSEAVQHSIAQNIKKEDELKQTKVNNVQKQEGKKIKADERGNQKFKKRSKQYKQYTKDKILSEVEEDEEDDDDDTGDVNRHIDIKI